MERLTWNQNGATRETGSTPALAVARGPRPIAHDPIRIVDAAVRAVLADFLVPSRRPSSSNGRAAVPVFADRLFSLRLAETLPADVRSIKIAPGTVMTPLARDYLKRRGIDVRLAGAAEIAPSVRGEWAFAIDGSAGHLQALQRTFLEDPRLWTELEPSLDDLTGWIQNGEGRGALLVTIDAALAVWRACQFPGVRAAFAAEPADARSAARSLGVNLLVVDPTGKSISWIRQIALAFRGAGAPRFAEEPAGLGEASR